MISESIVEKKLDEIKKIIKCYCYPGETPDNFIGEVVINALKAEKKWKAEKDNNFLYFIWKNIKFSMVDQRAVESGYKRLYEKKVRSYRTIFDEKKDHEFENYFHYETPLTKLLQKENHVSLNRAIKELPIKQRKILWLYYFRHRESRNSEKRMKNIGKMFGVGEARISQINKIILKNLRLKIKENDNKR